MSGGSETPVGVSGDRATAGAGPVSVDSAARSNPSAPTGDPTDELSGLADTLARGRTQNRMSRSTRWSFAALFLFLWFIGWIVPVITGVPFLIVALVLMAPDIPFAHRLAARIQRKLPIVRRTIPRRWRRHPRERR